MDKNKISDKIIEMVENKIGGYPSFVHTDAYTHEGFLKLTKDSEEIWVNQYVNENNIIKLEGLYNYKDSGIYIYYVSHDKTYKFVFMSSVEKTGTLIFTIKALKEYKLIKWK